MVDKALDKQSKASKQSKTREWKKQLAGFRQKDKLWNQFRCCLLQTSGHGSPDRNWPRVWRNKNETNNKAHGKSRDSHFLTNRPRAKHMTTQMTMTYRDQQQTYFCIVCLFVQQDLIPVVAQSADTTCEEYFLRWRRSGIQQEHLRPVDKLLCAVLWHRHLKRSFACAQVLRKAHFLIPVLNGRRKDFF